jgi:thymidylate synthase (FAD)
MEILDHGYVELVETWGSDERIIEAARMSTNKGFKGWGSPDEPGDEKLLRFLYEHKHHTPFEMAGMIIEVKAPIFVFREWHRHRTQWYSEMSSRYTPLPDENYMPTMDRMMLYADDGNKQAGTIKGSEPLSCIKAEGFRQALQKHYDDAQSLYAGALAVGVPKELARIHLPVGRYSCMRAGANLRNWLAFITLREDVSAQYEIRQYAHAVSNLVKDKFPRTHALYLDCRTQE